MCYRKQLHPQVCWFSFIFTITFYDCNIELILDTLDQLLILLLNHTQDVLTQANQTKRSRSDVDDIIEVLIQLHLVMWAIRLGLDVFEHYTSQREQHHNFQLFSNSPQLFTMIVLVNSLKQTRPSLGASDLFLILNSNSTTLF